MSRGRALVLGSLLVLHPVLVLPLLVLAAHVLIPVLRVLVPLLGFPAAVLGIASLVVQLVHQLGMRAGLVAALWWEVRRDRSLSGIAVLLTATEAVPLLVMLAGVPFVLLAVAAQLRGHPWLALFVAGYLGWFVSALARTIREALARFREHRTP